MLHPYRPSRSRQRQRGQSLAEFALVFPVLMLIIGGIIQFGVIFWGQNTLTQIARDTGRWAATQQKCDLATQAAVIATANSIAQQSSLIGYTATSLNTVVAWPAQPPPHDTDPCPPRNNQDVRYVTSGLISSSTEFRMEPKPQ